MLHIIAIGGGELHDRSTIDIDRAIVAATGKPRPNALFVPTASEDACGYCRTFEQLYGLDLGCDVDVLRLVERRPGPTTIQALIGWADLIYVGGGDTERMLEVWRQTGVDTLLKQKAATGTIMAGLSAGAECWFREFPREQPYLGAGAPLQGLGLVEMAAWVHLDPNPTEWQGMTNLVSQVGGSGIGLPDCTAIEMIDGRYRILSCRGAADAVHFWWQQGRVATRLLEPSAGFRTLSELLSPTA